SLIAFGCLQTLVTLMFIYGNSGSELMIWCNSSGDSASMTEMLQYFPATRHKYTHLPDFCHFCEVSCSRFMYSANLSSLHDSGMLTSISTTYIIIYLRLYFSIFSKSNSMPKPNPSGITKELSLYS